MADVIICDLCWCQVPAGYMSDHCDWHAGEAARLSVAALRERADDMDRRMEAAATAVRNLMEAVALLGGVEVPRG